MLLHSSFSVSSEGGAVEEVLVFSKSPSGFTSGSSRSLFSVSFVFVLCLEIALLNENDFRGLLSLREVFVDLSPLESTEHSFSFSFIGRSSSLNGDFSSLS